MIIRTCAFARAGLIGNPSDGFNGKTIAIAMRNFRADVTLWESPDLHIAPDHRDVFGFDSVDALVGDVRMHGYYGGVRLLKATIKRFADYCSEHGIALPARNFTIQYHTSIPRLVGLGGSSAIIAAAVRALMQFYDVQIPKPIQPSVVLSVEKDELQIPAGLQDRVAQVYEGVTYMDFDKSLMDAQGHGYYEPIDPSLLPNLYVAFAADQAEPTERFHSTAHILYDQGKSDVVAAINQIAELAVQARQALIDGHPEKLGPLLDRNFDLRASVFPIKPAHREMVEAARRVGATAKFAGSGGSIIGTYESTRQLAQLREQLEAKGCRVIIPETA